MINVIGLQKKVGYKYMIGKEQFIRSFIDYCESVIGAPYIWGGNGETVWTPDGMKDMVTYQGGPNPYGVSLGFDCVGLIKRACLHAGGPDLIATHNAQTIWDEISKPDWSNPYLHFYGANEQSISHIALDVGEINIPGCVLVVEAAGGNHLTKTWEDAHALPRAKVRWGREIHGQFIGSTSMLGLLDLKGA